MKATNFKPVDGLGESAGETAPKLDAKTKALSDKFAEVEAARHEMEQAELTARHTAEVWKRKACEFFDMFEQQN